MLPRFLEERHAVCRGIRHLELSLNLRYVDLEHSDEDQETFLYLCQAVSTLLHLDELNVNFSIEDDEVDKLKPGINTHKCLEAIHSLLVQKDFGLSIKIGYNYWAFESETEYKVHLFELVYKWNPVIRGIMYPNTLRVSGKPPGTEKYLRSKLSRRAFYGRDR